MAVVRLPFALVIALNSNVQVVASGVSDTVDGLWCV